MSLVKELLHPDPERNRPHGGFLIWVSQLGSFKVVLYTLVAYMHANDTKIMIAVIIPTTTFRVSLAPR